MDTWAAFEARELICIKDLWICPLCYHCVTTAQLCTVQLNLPTLLPLCSWICPLSFLKTGSIVVDQNCTTCYSSLRRELHYKCLVVIAYLYKISVLIPAVVVGQGKVFDIICYSLFVWNQVVVALRKSGGASDFNTPNLTFSDLLRLPEAERYFTRHTKRYYIGHSSSQMNDSWFEPKSSNLSSRNFKQAIKVSRDFSTFTFYSLKPKSMVQV